MRVHTLCALQDNWQHYWLRDMPTDPEACDSVCMCVRQCIRGSFDSCHNSCSSPAPGPGGPPPSAPAFSTRWLGDSSQSQGVSVFIQPPLLPPLIQLFVSFFQTSPGRSVCRCCLSSMAGRLAEGNLWRASVECCLTNSLLQLSRVPMQASHHPHPAASLQLAL